MASTRTLVVPTIYSRILTKFPQNFSFCFAYGSGVKKQVAKPVQNGKGNMIDLIYCIDNPVKWHEQNLKDNWSHYSALKYLGHNFIAKFQENSGARVYYNTLVNMEDVMIKYGIISTKDLETDLLDWCDLYLAGRLHKPVEIIKKPSTAQLQTALQLNLQSAVHAALLLLPETFTEYEFYYTVSNLSYSGDFRMTFGENKSKVENIVKPQLVGFRNLYLPIIRSMSDYVDFPIAVSSDKVLTDATGKTVDTSCLPKNGNKTDYAVTCTQDGHPSTKLHHLNQLPKCPQKALVRFWNKGSLRQDTEDVLRAMAYDPDCSTFVDQCIKEIVWNSSIKQSLKGLLTAGFFKSVKYSGRKLKKMWD